MTDEKRLNKSRVSRIKPSCLVLFSPLGYFCGTSWLFLFRWVEMKNPLNKWLAIIKSPLTGVARNPQTSHEKRSNKSTCYYFLIGEQTERSFRSHSLGQSYQMRKLHLRSMISILGGGPGSWPFGPFPSWCFDGIEYSINTRETSALQNTYRNLYLKINTLFSDVLMEVSIQDCDMKIWLAYLCHISPCPQFCTVKLAFQTTR